MPRQLIALLAVAAVMTLGTGRHGRPGPQAGRSFRVATWNVQKGIDSRGRYRLARIADTIAELQPHLIGVQELTRNHASFDCDDQPRRLADLLSERTGQRWHHVYVKEWDTQKRECVERGRGDEHETEGLAFLAPEPLTQVEHVPLWNGRIGLAARVRSGPEITVIVTHLAHGANMRDRVRQLDKLLPWSAQRNGSRILLGDLNAESTAPELAPVFEQYRDAWREAERAGRARGIRSGSTRPGRDSRIDYILYTPSSGLELESTEVPDTFSIFAGDASDHRPVVTTFRID